MEEDVPDLKENIDPESLAYWFFRLNGFLTIINFVVHPDIGTRQRTDVDILACRFPHRKELLINPMKDYDIFEKEKEKIYVAIAEVKTQRCKLNGPWTKPHSQNMQRVLRAIGVIPVSQIDHAAFQIYENGYYEISDTLITLICVGSQKNKDLLRKYPRVPQLTWDIVLAFIYERFKAYAAQKASHPQWDESGKKLWDAAFRCTTIEEFTEMINVTSIIDY